MTDPPGLVSRRSGHDVEETTRRLRAAAEAAGLTIFADIDHARGAAGAGMTLRPTRLLVFGAARGGTPLMQAAQTAGIDLPLKALVWQDADGASWVSCNAPEWVAERHGAGEAAAAAVAAMSAGLSRLVEAAVA
jgi:uncharacterized protein (DUF302 family)